MASNKIDKKIPRDATAPLDGDCFEMKMPNIVKIQPKPFDPDNYQPENSIKYMSDHGKEKYKSFNLLNVIRWRYTDKTEEPFIETDSVKDLRESVGYKARYPDLEIESNTKIVEWSDGTHSLIVGDEYFDMGFSKATNTHVYLKTDDLMIHKNQIDRKCIVKPSILSKRAKKAILKHVNEKAKEQHHIEKTTSINDDPKFRRGKVLEKKEKLERANEKKRQRRDFGRFGDF